ncbi:GAF domain-containing hybrid sensor histidine kinase/response regulator [Flavobacterium johnsoniae]|uniref:histidine kinase n=1 Tax=Flavobacterium johnsoniae (strain ATCC 17061 / DSM 2064 / JCM 8514 / BCRC 14874 / CCUG 350202 / NBRC 14942 / NCIMB 11054 / UW101) TaxID=376686 RepID=A5FC18_FLAJ1|nr:GAF domain-containing hybrid sensor histidine kinase/response regulator [Flavobacterium johnsoniae]ABQ07251.1 GAF sensor hybrid histidine kinase [Flavobacterium johnsoniae UW101]OXE95873.1 hybrid sensor histidine kinase/response regulator [Flavobacterium johnsoniae UW101]WQG80911.1 ATP-binding protein [Flavobacterium johnsoniae UW101]SHL25800.1 GAF sensor hybrid histidine kinase [Flavobacterium johnsoniae]
MPYNESERLDILKRYSNMLEALPGYAFDDATSLVSYICGVPIAYIAFIDENRQWFKSEIGLGFSIVPREITFSRYTIMDSSLVEIQDTLLNERFKDDPDVKGGLKIRFYAGMPLITPDGHAVGVLCAADHEPRSLNENQKRALHIVARHVITTLELGIKNNELLRQKKIAESAVLAKESFLANMSHEIRTPLNAIIGFTELLSGTPLDKQQQAFIQDVQTAGENLLLIVNDILDLSKIESGGLSLEKQPFNLKKSLRHVYDLLKVKTADGVEFNLFLDAELPDVITGDQGRLNQIMVNLAGNALKFTNEGEVTISVKNKGETEDSYTIRFSVKDTGIGIPKEHLESIFERFTQGQEDTTRKFGGTGLGLSIVKELVKLHDSKIQVKSREGAGSEFFFTTTYKKPANVKENPKLLPVNDLGRLKILLLEDNRLNQKLAQNVIEGFGFEIDIAENGDQGIKLLSENQYDLVLMDLQMPARDGYQTTHYIRSELKNEIPIIAMTAHSLADEHHRCLNAGMDGYVPKPFKQHELLEAIKQALKKDRRPLIPSKADLSAIEKTDRIKPGWKKEVTSQFIQKAPVELKELQQAVYRKDFRSVLQTAEQLQVWLHLFLLENLSQTLTSIEDQARKKEFTAETADNLDILHCNIEEIIKEL